MDDLPLLSEGDLLPGAVWLRANWAELEARGVQNFEWVAVDGDLSEPLLAHGPDLEGVVAEVRRLRETESRSIKPVFAFYHRPQPLSEGG